MLTKARNFLVFQGDVESVAARSPKELTQVVWLSSPSSGNVARAHVHGPINQRRARRWWVGLRSDALLPPAAHNPLRRLARRAQLFEQMSGSLDLKEEYEQLRDEDEAAQQSQKFAYQKKRAMNSESKQVPL